MSTIKSFSDLQQSKKLAEFLPLESADMFYISGKGEPIFIGNKMVACGEDDYDALGEPDVLCWSLAALLDIIPQEIFDGEYIINITEGCDNRWVLTYDHHENRNHSYYGLSTGADNIVDACTDIIIKLKERNII